MKPLNQTYLSEMSILFLFTHSSINVLAKSPDKVFDFCVVDIRSSLVTYLENYSL